MKKILLFLQITLFSGYNVFAQSIDQKKLEELIHFNDSLYANEVLVIYKGEEIAYWRDEACENRGMGTASMLKSWTGLAFGTLLDQGLIGNLEEPACKWLPEWKEGCDNNVTLRHLITMTSGFNRRSGAKGILGQDDNYSYLMETRLDTMPGIRFGYSNESVQLLGMVLERASGMDAQTYFKKHLFAPLGMDSTTLVKDRAGKNWVTYGGCLTTIRDVAKIGMLLRQNGQYNGKQIVSENWINDSLTPSALAPYYGQLWWIDGNSDHFNVAAMGDPGVMMIWFPGLDLLFLRNQACKTEMKYSSALWMGPHFIRKISEIVLNN